VKALQHRLEYVLLRLLVGALSLLPDRVAGTVGAVLGRLGYWPFRIRRRQAEENVRAAFPDRDDAWVQRVVRASYEHLGRELMMILRMPSKTPEQIRAMTRVHGIELGDARYREGKGVVVTAGHFGNWEMGAAMVAVRGYRVDAIVMRQANPLFDDYIVRTRKRLGIGVIRRGGATQAAVQSLQEGKAVAFAADQNANRKGIFVPFFGRLASTHRGAALIALRTGAPHVHRDPRARAGRHLHTMAGARRFRSERGPRRGGVAGHGGLHGAAGSRHSRAPRAVPLAAPPMEDATAGGNERRLRA
jgi:Kdo2-lipid IVA lauroyltransferase/acyltransferase